MTTDPTATPTRTTTERRRLVFSVRARITVAVALLTALALAGAGLLVYVLGRASVDDDVRQQVDQEMTEFAKVAGGDPAPASVSDLVLRFLQGNVTTPSELQVGFWDGGSHLWSPSSREQLKDDPAFVEAVSERIDAGGVDRIQTRWGEVHLEVQPLSVGTTDGGFVVAYFVDDEYEQLQRTMRTYAVAALLALALVTALAAWQAGRLLRPLRVLRDTARAIEEGDLSRRIPETGNDDITDLTRTVNGMLARLEQAFEGQRAFLDDAGHELRTPLTILRGHLELLDADDPEEFARTRELVLDEVDRMSRLVDELMLLARADRPDFVTFEPCDLARLQTTVVEKCRALGDRRWTLDALADARVLLDEQRITQALLQLAENAVKHTGRDDTIGLGSAVDDGSVQFWVRDTGPGISGADKAVVFERFARGEVPSEDDGFGLGLSIVAAISAGHGGTVAVRDEEPHGARFVIEIPARRSI